MLARDRQLAPNDPFHGFQWGQQQLHTDPAWTTSTGAGQTIAIVDSGIKLSHPDLAGKIVDGATFTGCAANANGRGNGDRQSARAPARRARTARTWPDRTATPRHRRLPASGQSTRTEPLPSGAASAARRRGGRPHR